eukprot:TRINITY_DN86757_c0_g1_i1.p1 TRINITY_DN86757_c0_g1~~TRINITY_DN86757_c0_g1_i1.p1  ORF type:complete len:181 (-),score=8.34 TRINITY_DN86757_c0_g1_i1:146-658(-)
MKELLDSFQAVELTWDISLVGGDSGSNVLVLEPGYSYVFRATVKIQPIIYQNQITISKLKGWKVEVTGQSVSRSKLMLMFSSQASLRYRISFEQELPVLSEEAIYGLLFLIKDLGAVAGLLGLGVIVLKCWNLIFGKLLKKTKVPSAWNTIVENLVPSMQQQAQMQQNAK